MKKITNIIIWALLLFLITPTTMALASWNSVPGDATYPWKLSLEKVLLMFMSPSSKLASTTQVKIAERRFNELEQTLSGEYAFESLDNLEKQLDATTSNIQSMDKEEARDQVKAQYIASLKKMSASLDEQKSQVVTGKTKAVAQKSTSTSKKPAPSNSPVPAQPTNNPPANNNSKPVNNPTSVPSNTPTPTPAVPPSDEELIEEIEETQDKIEQEIIKVETASTTPTNNNKNRDDDEEEEKKPKWVKPEPTVQNIRTSTGNVTLPNTSENDKNNDRMAPAQNNVGQRSGSANWLNRNIDMD